MVGGGGRPIVRIAAKHADISNITWELGRAGKFDPKFLTEFNQTRFKERIDYMADQCEKNGRPRNAVQISNLIGSCVVTDSDAATVKTVDGIGRALVEHVARIPAEADLGSEFRYRRPLVGPRALAVAISQSGETADTIAASREARAQGARTLAVANVVGSTLAREADDVLYTRAGPEIAVCSTKAYLTQLAALTMLAVHLGQVRETLDPARGAAVIRALRGLPTAAQAVLRGEPEIASLAARLYETEDVFFIGRGIDYYAAMEGSLKFKEISYIHSEALAGGELKHGTLALVTPGVVVVALATQPDLVDKTVSNIQQVRARGADVIGVATDATAGTLRPHVNTLLRVPATDPLLTPVLSVIPLQLFAYHVARLRGNDVDQPRNLAKSVTVE
jgi:glucosamine--fructose-6-phosphate aminotransferase (isomerizing)